MYTAGPAHTASCKLYLLLIVYSNNCWVSNKPKSCSHSNPICNSCISYSNYKPSCSNTLQMKPTRVVPTLRHSYTPCPPLRPGQMWSSAAQCPAPAHARWWWQRAGCGGWPHQGTADRAGRGGAARTSGTIETRPVVSVAYALLEHPPRLCFISHFMHTLAGIQRTVLCII